MIAHYPLHKYNRQEKQKMNTYIRTPKALITVFALFCLTIFCLSTNSMADEKYRGWEIDSEYNKLYNNKERDRLKGVVVKFVKVKPLENMTNGTALLLDEGDGEKILVHICPEEFASARETGIRKGATVKIKGSWAIIDDEDVFMAAKIKQGENYSFKVRLTSDGKPFWTMSPEELAKERKNN